MAFLAKGQGLHQMPAAGDGSLVNRDGDGFNLGVMGPADLVAGCASGQALHGTGSAIHADHLAVPQEGSRIPRGNHRRNAILTGDDRRM
jgi:hypothetical protein